MDVNRFIVSWQFIAKSFLFTGFLLYGCAQSGKDPFVWPDHSKQQVLISTDTLEGFFEQITAMDMLLQLQMFSSSTDWDDLDFWDNFLLRSLREEYLHSLQESVMPWTESDKSAIAPLLQQAAQNLNHLNPSLFSEPVYMVKTDGRHYGAGVWYTRQNAIIVPRNVIPNPAGSPAYTPTQGMDRHNFRRVIYHEVFHIISRYHPDLRHQLYEIIGFYPADAPLQLPLPLETARLSNPDGVNIHYLFRFDPHTLGVPLIFAEVPDEFDETLQFFDVLQFAFFNVVGSEVKTEVIEHETFPEFRQNIGTLTNYIIHPDEIIADYFAFLMMSVYEQSIDETDHPLNLKILRAIHQTIKNYRPVSG